MDKVHHNLLTSHFTLLWCFQLQMVVSNSWEGSHMDLNIAWFDTLIPPKFGQLGQWFRLVWKIDSWNQAFDLGELASSIMANWKFPIKNGAWMRFIAGEIIYKYRTVVDFPPFSSHLWWFFGHPRQPPTSHPFADSKAATGSAPAFPADWRASRRWLWRGDGHEVSWFYTVGEVRLLYTICEHWWIN